MSGIAAGASNPKKIHFFEKVHDLVRTCPEVMTVSADNVGSLQLAQIRLALRGKATIQFGKNTLIRACLKRLIDADMPEVQALSDIIALNCGMIFCHDATPTEVRKILAEFKVPAPAKQGAVAQCDVFIPAGPTGMDPGQTSFFQTLGIPTKIFKGQIEIQNEVHIIKKGERVTAGQAVLLQKLNIMPFAYGLIAENIYNAGSVYPASVLDISEDDITASIKAAIAQVASVSLGVGMPTAASAPHSIINAFKEVAGVAIAADYVFPEIEAIKNAIENPELFAAAAPAAAAAAPAAAAVVEEESESDDDMGFSLFD